MSTDNIWSTEFVMTDECELRYIHLDKPFESIATKYPDTTPKYQLQIVLQKDETINYNKIKTAATAAAQIRLSKQWQKARMPYQLKDNEWIITAKSANQPEVLTVVKNVTRKVSQAALQRLFKNGARCKTCGHVYGRMRVLTFTDDLPYVAFEPLVVILTATGQPWNAQTDFLPLDNAPYCNTVRAASVQPTNVSGSAIKDAYTNKVVNLNENPTRIREDAAGKENPNVRSGRNWQEYLGV